MLASDAVIEYELPEKIPPMEYDLTLEVNTVHAKQVPLVLTIDGGDPIDIEIPYTIGEWGKTTPVRVGVQGDSVLRFTHKKPCFGLAIKKIILS